MQRWSPIAGCAGQPEGTHITWSDHCAEIERLTAERDNAEKREYEVLGRANALGVSENELLDILALFFEEYEYGPDCYEDPEDYSGYLGKAVHLDDATFHRVADILNERRPRQTPNLNSTTPNVG